MGAAEREVAAAQECKESAREEDNHGHAEQGLVVERASAVAVQVQKEEQDEEGHDEEDVTLLSGAHVGAKLAVHHDGAALVVGAHLAVFVGLIGHSDGNGVGIKVGSGSELVLTADGEVVRSVDRPCVCGGRDACYWLVWFW